MEYYFAAFIGICIGLYLGITIATFAIVLFGVALGGKNEDIWKPFVYALVWPIYLPLLILGKI